MAQVVGTVVGFFLLLGCGWLVDKLLPRRAPAGRQAETSAARVARSMRAGHLLVWVAMLVICLYGAVSSAFDEVWTPAGLFLVMALFFAVMAWRLWRGLRWR